MLFVAMVTRDGWQARSWTWPRRTPTGKAKPGDGGAAGGGATESGAGRRCCGACLCAANIKICRRELKTLCDHCAVSQATNSIHFVCSNLIALELQCGSM